MHEACLLPTKCAADVAECRFLQMTTAAHCPRLTQHFPKLQETRDCCRCAHSARRRVFGQALSTVPACSFESAVLLADQVPALCLILLGAASTSAEISEAHWIPPARKIATHDVHKTTSCGCRCGANANSCVDALQIGPAFLGNRTPAAQAYIVPRRWPYLAACRPCLLVPHSTLRCSS